MPPSAPLVVAVDGPSGSGKSSVSRRVAERFGLSYLDTGAMYRALTWSVLRAGSDPEDPGAVAAAVQPFAMSISVDPRHAKVDVGDVDVTAAIRGAAVTAAVSAVSAVPAVRERLVTLQREIVGTGGIVVEGRDIGTTVCPGAQVKIFLTADAHARAHRRSLELTDRRSPAVTPERGTSEPEHVEQVRADLERRDRFDASRAASPLAQAADAIALDSTSLDADGVIATVLSIVQEQTGVRPLAASAVGDGR